MKKIEDASLENSKAHYCQAFSLELHIDADIDFCKGIEFAQRWISVKEELPLIGVPVIVKERFNKYDVYFFHSAKDRLIKCQDNCITHWRPIEIK